MILLSILNNQDSHLLQRTKKKYPHFLDKSSNSNLSKHLFVLNDLWLDLFQDINTVKLATILDRPIQIKKTQSEFYKASYDFKVKLPHLKVVEILQEGEVIKTFTFDNLNHSEVNYHIEVTDTKIIPNVDFLVKVTTFDEFYYEKGYPENDVQEMNSYDHDYNLDILGDLYNVHRFNHLTVDDYDLPNTLPPYFDGATEDDYYFMKRIKEYLENFDSVPLPLLEFRKFYGIDAEMINRHYQISKQEGGSDLGSYMDTSSFPVDEYMGTKENWNSCVYDINCNYDDFPTNLRKPTDVEINDIFLRNMNIVDSAFFNLDITTDESEDLCFNDDFTYKLGELSIVSSKKIINFNCRCKNIELDNHLINLIVDTDDNFNKDYFIIIDDTGDIYLSSDNREDSQEWNSTLSITDEGIMKFTKEVTS